MFKIIDENLDSVDFKEFKNPKDGKKYYKKDLTPLKDKLQIDEIVIVFVEYGVKVNYSYGIETSKFGRSSIQTEIVNLKNNSYVIRDETYATQKIQGGWITPPEYENLKQSIQTAIQKAIKRDKEKYNIPKGVFLT